MGYPEVWPAQPDACSGGLSAERSGAGQRKRKRASLPMSCREAVRLRFDSVESGLFHSGFLVDVVLLFCSVLYARSLYACYHFLEVRSRFFIGGSLL